MDREEAKRIVEALLFVSDKPVQIETLREVIGEKAFAAKEIEEIINSLNTEYSSQGRAFALREIAGGYQMVTDPIFSKWIAELYRRPADKLRGPALETLAIIAYKQPITRMQIEAIRGVNVDGVLTTLEDRKLIKTRGRAEGPGRPILYGTTNEFLIHFGLKSLEELPNLKEFKEADLDFIKEMNKAEVINTQTGQLEVGSPAGADAPGQVDPPEPQAVSQDKETGNEPGQTQT
jgi:segregation and condensation protein B